MNSSVILTENLIKTVQQLPATERTAIANALVNEFILGEDPTTALNPFQNLIYAIISTSLKRDTARMLPHLPTA